MDPSSAQHHQEMSSQTLESMLVCTKAQQQEKKPRPLEQALKCPRCDSTNTKFCYYNNYSLTQPRYFCKSCRRYWTKGGTLRNVPVGGGCRKNTKRSSSSSSSATSSSSSAKRGQDQPLMANIPHNPFLSGTNGFAPFSNYDSTDLSLAFARLQNQASGHLGFDHHDNLSMLGNLGNSNSHGSNSAPHGFLDALRGGFLETPINGFHNAYYGDNVGHTGEMSHVENGGGGVNVNVSEEMSLLPFDHEQDHMTTSGAAKTAVTMTTVKHESCNGREAAEGNRVLWGFPWQIGGGDGNMGVDAIEPAGRQSWNGLGASWHGLINSPLM